nr:radical SAM protein [uncultured Flavonifractor sp.]
MIPEEHPCFSDRAHFRYGRIHLPVAPKCNIRCKYCDRRYDCANESRPGVTSAVLSPEAALNCVEQALYRDDRIRVAGVAGPGEPLANPATLETLRMVRSHFPSLLLCLSTNGLTLTDHLPELLDCGVSTITVTVNTLSTACAGHIYRAVAGSTDTYALSAFLAAQQEGVAKAAEAGLTVKINTVVIPGINTLEIESLAHWAATAGASIMNLMPLIPQADLRDMVPPSQNLLDILRARAGTHLPQFTRCKQCRADAVGVPGEVGCSGCF